MTQSAYGRLKPIKGQINNKSAYEAPHLVVGNSRGNSAEGVRRMSDGSYEADTRVGVGDSLALNQSVELPHAPAHTHLANAELPSEWGYKRALDIFGAVALAVVFMPLIVAVVFLLRRSGGTVIYRHRRVGKDGRMFECLKFRTMVPDADRELHTLLESNEELKAEWIQNHKLKDDPRITAIGRFLRRTSLDELPQLWNVLRGDMSLVGPRPIVREELLRYGRSASVYLAVKPGITGLWQTTGRNNTDYRRRVAMDVYYVRNQSLWLDAYILLRTTGVVLGGTGAY
jgi:exopolysaccharide production protein ExoY